MILRPAVAAALIFALAACGSGDAPEEAAEAAGEAVAGETPAPAEAATPAPEDGATPAAEASETATPSPSPTATRATPSPTPTPVAVAGPPDSFRQCAVCHKTERGQHGLGPSLAGVFGARAGHAAGFSYSPAMAEANLTWNQATLGRYLANPQGVVPGTTMAFAGVSDPADRAAIIAYLKTL
jgi:cytochrome c2